MIYDIIGWVFPLLAVFSAVFAKGVKNKGAFLAGLAFTVLIVRAFKLFFDIPRPEDALVLLESSRFPSTHAAISFYPLGFFFKDKRRWLLAALVVLGVLGSYSRIFLQVHTYLDIFVGGLIGLAVGIIFFLASDSILRKKST